MKVWLLLLLQKKQAKEPILVIQIAEQPQGNLGCYLLIACSM